MGYKLAENTAVKSVLEGLSYLAQEMERVAQLMLAGRDKEVDELLMMMEESLASKDIVVRQQQAVMEASQYVKQLANIEASISRAGELMRQERRKEAADTAKYELGPFLRELAEEVYFWGFVHSDEAKMKEYYAAEFAENHANTRPAVCDVSIVVPAYNKFEYTKICVSSLLELTDFNEASCELILVNHGSSDETEDYFRNLKVPDGVRKKVITFKENVRMLMFSTVMRSVEGHHMAFVNNDTILTKDWLRVLRTCLKQSEKAVCAVPVTPNTSNLQFTLEYLELMESDERAKLFVNEPDSSRWDRRVRVMPVIALYDVKKVNRIGFADRYFQTMEFWDDDFSLRARRAGMEQILCRDGYCYHFGTVTGKEAQVKESTLELGGELFYHKHGLRAWEAGCCYHYFAIGMLEHRWRLDTQKPSVLGVDCGYGDSLLQIQNILKRKNQEAKLFHLSSNPAFEPDCTPWCEGFHGAEKGENMAAALRTAFSGKKFDCVYLEKKLNEYPDWKGLVQEAADRLNSGGYLLLSLRNPYAAKVVASLAVCEMPKEKEELRLIAPDRVTEHLMQTFSFVQPMRVLDRQAKIGEDADGDGKSSADQAASLEAATDYYLYLCTK